MPDPSITYWNRLEPRPRCDDIAVPLAAEIRDPAWMLTRQWQIGEFMGEDAASPAYVKVTADAGAMVTFHLGATNVALDGKTPPERQALSEAQSPDLALRAELGQTFAALLVEKGVPAAVDAFRTAMPVQAPPAPPDPTRPFNPVDSASRRFAKVCAGHSIDGYRVYRVAKGLDTLPSGVPSSAPVLAAIADLGAWADDVFGPIGEDDPKAWNPQRLEYSIQLDAANPAGGSALLSVHPGEDGDLGWEAFDIVSLGTASVPPTTQTTVAMVPGHVRFPGMPNLRFWDFETAATDFGDVKLDRRDLVKLLVVDFALVHGSDWFVLPFDQEVGSLARIASLVVRDVFGSDTTVLAADAPPEPASGPGRWSMFRTSFEGGGTIAPPSFFLLPPSAGRALEVGAAIEDVRFARDEMANMAWGIERSVASDIGEPRPGPERDAAVSAALQALTVTPAPTTSPLHYDIGSVPPVHWIPLLPVAVGPAANGVVALEKAKVVHPSPITGIPAEVMPAGRLLNPAVTGPYQIREEEMPRNGTRVQRVVYRSRGFDGSTHIWVSRRKLAGAGEAQSGLRYDRAVSTGQQG